MADLDVATDRRVAPITPDLGSILPHAAARFGAKPALIIGERSFTYAELDELSDRVAGGLAALGVRRGDRVSLYSPNRWEWVIAYHAAFKAAAALNPINVMLTSKEVAYVLNDCGASVIITSGDKAEAILALTRDVPSLRRVVSFDAPAGEAAWFGDLLRSPDGPPVSERPAPSALSTIGYTSGTTGHPKGAMQSHRAVFLNAALHTPMLARTDRDTMLNGLPLPHVYGNIIMNGTFMAGGTLVLMERFDPGAALELIEQHRVTLFDGVPTMYATMLAHPRAANTDLSSLTRCAVGGQTIPVATVEEWERRSGAPLIELWGMTEIAGAGTTHSLYAPNVHGSIGVAMPGIEVRVAALDDASVTMAPGEAGELMVRGPIVMSGYYGNVAATRETIEPDGWLHSGDVAVADEEGHFFVVDRKKDMIITSGYNVYPAEIERVIAAHEAVSMIAVGSVSDPIKGELARAYVVLRPGAKATEAEIIEHCRPHLASYKLPRSVAFVADLPKTSTGKIMRRELRKLDG